MGLGTVFRGRVDARWLGPAPNPTVGHGGGLQAKTRRHLVSGTNIATI